MADLSVNLAAMRVLLGRGLPVDIRATGVSMFPCLMPGVTLHVLPAAPRRADVVVVLLGGRLVAHRVVSVDERQIVTRGDATRHNDRPCPLADVLGVVDGTSRAYGRLVLALAPVSHGTLNILSRVYRKIAALIGAPT